MCYDFETISARPSQAKPESYGKPYQTPIPKLAQPQRRESDRIWIRIRLAPAGHDFHRRHAHKHDLDTIGVQFHYDLTDKAALGVTC